eukprot:CAMPEP_0179271400 /NCGR_PEP_ID=MMETSP0797-20121207/31963_1 /TAXON_ID=47934 /ORGANISM="Dinophysis acuminata, Strain DAEP01" /LENGTH=77 /DNA_ID=CAMNT_0020979765 /DNA_START=80 /DNA_END=310 /DNA_ORIENTATION=-
MQRRPVPHAARSADPVDGEIRLGAQRHDVAVPPVCLGVLKPAQTATMPLSFLYDVLAQGCCSIPSICASPNCSTRTS